MSLPLLGTVGVLVLVGFRLGPWPPLGVAAATLLIVGVARRWAWPPRQLEGDPIAVERWRDERVNRVGQLLGAMTGVWLSISIVALMVVAIAALLVR